MEDILQQLRSFGPLSAALERHLEKKMKVFYCKKKAILLREGDIAGHIFYLRRGLLRSFSLLDGKEVSNWFMKEGNFIISVESFLRQAPAPDWMQALEACEYVAMAYADLEETYKLYPEYERVGRLVTGHYYCLSEERHRSQRRRTPEEKFDYMMATDPGLVGRVLNKYMASYLDISPRTYTDLRSEYAKRKGSSGR